MQTSLDTAIEYLKGIGPQRAEVLKKELQIYTCADLINFFPFRYEDRSKFYNISDLSEEMPYVQLKGKIIATQIVESKVKRFTAILKDDTGTVELVWFQGIKYIKSLLKQGNDYVVFGKPNRFKNKYSIPHPDIEPLIDFDSDNKQTLRGVYHSSEKLSAKGLNSKGIQKIIATVIDEALNGIEEYYDITFLANYNLPDIKQAYKNIHFPANEEWMRKAIYRLKFDELFFLQLQLLKYKIATTKKLKGILFEKIADNFNNFYNNYLPFELTNAQKKVLKEIRKDTSTGMHMNRLLQGDVGSGKTVVALLSMLMAIDNGYQACLMAPTEILAAQHYHTIKNLINDMPVNIRLLTGSTRQSERREIHYELQTGYLNIIIGTHALLEEDVKFCNLGIACIDEQHRFGVQQRAKLWKKNSPPPHILVMTATPIPRTLAMTFYGDLDLSVIDELPPGRKPIKTLHFFENSRARVLGFIKEQIKTGRQIYVVYPLIEESETLDLLALEQGYEALQRTFPLPDYAISIVHGKLNADAKEYEMQRFVKGETQIMVATTVIEVGVNVPNASVMIIENAERFGLSQLHQLRGRVGRGAEQSYCILMTGDKLSKDARLRINTLCKTNDGFEIAEVDLKLRGPGDLMGTQQSGMLDLKLADLSKDASLIALTRNAAADIINNDPDLILPQHQKIKIQLQKMIKNRPNLGRIS